MGICYDHCVQMLRYTLLKDHSLLSNIMHLEQIGQKDTSLKNKDALRKYPVKRGAEHL